MLHLLWLDFTKLEETINIIAKVTVLPAKIDSDAMLCLQSYQGLRIDTSIVYLSYPQDRINIQVIYQFALAQAKFTR